MEKHNDIGGKEVERLENEMKIVVFVYLLEWF